MVTMESLGPGWGLPGGVTDGALCGQIAGGRWWEGSVRVTTGSFRWDPVEGSGGDMKSAKAVFG